MTKRLQILLYIITLYLTIFGLLFILLPDMAAEFTKTAPAPTLSLIYGQYSLTFALVAFLAAREQRRDNPLSFVILILLIGHVVVFSYELLTGLQAWAQAGPPIAINALLALLLYAFSRKSHK